MTDTTQDPPHAAAVTRWRKRQVVNEAVRWDGGNHADVEAFAVTADGTECFRWEAGYLELWNDQEDAWIPCPRGHWVMKGQLGEFYPVSGEALKAAYESAGMAAPHAAPASPDLSCAVCADTGSPHGVPGGGGQPAKVITVIGASPGFLRGDVMQVAAGLRREADAIEADLYLNPLARQADAGARRTAAGRIDLAVADDRRRPARDLRDAVEDALSNLCRLGDAEVPSRKGRTRAAIDEGIRVIRAAFEDAP